MLMVMMVLITKIRIMIMLKGSRTMTNNKKSKKTNKTTIIIIMNLLPKTKKRLNKLINHLGLFWES